MKVSAIIISIILGFFSLGWAQKYTANVRTFGVESGLSHNDARTVVVDERGLIWVGTRNGLNRFDGKQFKSFYTEDGLALNNVETLFSDGELLVCVHINKTIIAVEDITIFNTIDETVIPFSDWLGIEGVSTDNINLFYCNSKEAVLHATVDGENRWYLKKAGQPAVTFNIDVPFDFIGSSQNGHYWFHEWEEKRVTQRDLSGKLLQSFSTKRLDNFSGKFYVDMRFNQNEEWFYAYDSLYQINGNKLKHIKQLWGESVDKKKFLELPSEFVRKYPHFNLLWYSYNSSNYLVDSTGRIEFSYSYEDQFVNNTDLFLNNVVLQPTSEGLSILSIYPSNFQNFNVGAKGAFRGVVKLGNAYITCNDIGVQVLNNEFTEFSKFLSYVGNNAFKHGDFVYTAGRQTINKIDTNLNVVATYPLMFAHEVWGLYIEENDFYYSTYGLWYYNIDTKEQRQIISADFPELNKATIYSIQPKSNKEFWLVATSGLYIWNKETEQFEKVAIDVVVNGGFQHLYETEGNIWLASSGSGLLKYNKDTKRSERFDFAHRATNIVHAVYPDNNDNLWLSTDHGIVRFNLTTKQYRVFKEKDGLVNNEFNRLSHYKDPDGTIVFGGIKGIVRFHPDSLTNTEVQKPRLKPFVVDAWLYKKGGDIISQVTQEFNQDNTIEVRSQDRFLSFDLATTNVEYYDDVMFGYRMDDDLNWKELPSNKLAFNILPFGEHKITIRASLPNGYVSEENLTLEVNSIKPIYLRYWFMALVIFFLVLTSTVAVVIRTKRLERQKLLLENEIQKRTKEIVDDKEIIEKQANELKSLDKLKNRFFANISHELRNPLTLILGPVENLLAQEKVKVPSMVRSQMVLTLKNAKRLQKRINEILALSKIDAGKLSLTISAVNANKFFRRLTLAYMSLANSRDVEVFFESELDDSTDLKLDTDNVEKVLNNLLSNAIKHSPSQTQVLISLYQANDGLFVITVLDQGVGIEETEREKIFDRYYQSKNGQKAGGTGLGLALSKELAQIMGGDIKVENGAKSGAKFIFSFKAESGVHLVDKELDEGDMRLYDEEENFELENTNFEANILVVEDNEEMRLYIKGILGSSFRVFEAENGKEAIDVLGKRKIDIITSDLMMPEMDGMEFLEYHKNSAKKHIPVVMVTARADDADKLNALEIGVDDYITKPFYARELMARVQNLLKNRLVRLEAEQEVEEVEASDVELQMQSVIDVIKEHLHSNTFTVIDLAEKVGYSERQLRRIIKKEKGVSPTALMKELRLHQARTYFETQRFATISEVLFACGFKSTGHFAKNYFERFGKKPSEYFE